MSKTSIYFSLENVDGKHAVKELKRELDTLRGVISVSVNDETECVAVDFDTTGVDREKIQSKLEKMRYKAVDSRLENHNM